MKTIHTITEKHRLVALPDPMHPLVSVVRISDIRFVSRGLFLVLELACTYVLRSSNDIRERYGLRVKSKRDLHFILASQSDNLYLARQTKLVNPFSPIFNNLLAHL